MSTTYYALFHCLAGCCADTLIGKGASRRTSAWLRTYRALNHRQAREAFSRKEEMRRFRRELQDFAALFVELQNERHQADYNPFWTRFKSDVEQRIAETRSVIESFEAVPIPDRRAFAAHVLFRSRN